MGTLNMHAFTKVDQNLGQASYAMCLSSKLHFRVNEQTRACVSVCLHAITLIIPKTYTEKSLIDDTSCQNVYNSFEFDFEFEFEFDLQRTTNAM